MIQSIYTTKKEISHLQLLSEKVPNSVYGTITLAKCGKMMWDEITNNWS